MQTKPKKGLWIWALLVGIILSGIVITQFGDNGKEDVVIRNDGDYYKFLKDAENSNKDVLQKLASEEELTDRDKERLIDAERQFHSIVQYAPQKFAPYLVLGMIYHSLGNLTAAEQHLRRCIEFAPPLSTNPAVMETSAEAHYRLSKVLVDKGEYELAVGEVSSAISEVSANPNYYIGRAVAYSQLGKKADAKKDLEAALKLDPGNTRALGMMKLLARG